MRGTSQRAGSRAPVLGLACAALVAASCGVEEHPGWAGPDSATETTSGSTASGSSSSGGPTSATPTSGGSTSSPGTDSTSSTSGSTTSSTASTGLTAGSTSNATTSAGSTGGVAPRRIFVTELIRYGAFGGQSEADVLCQSEADGASLGGIWRALLSHPGIDARDALNLQGPLLNMMDQQVASGDADLWDGSLDAAIAFDQNGNVAGTRVWTGTLPDGAAAPDICEGWTAPTGNVSAVTGDSQALDGTWTEWDLYPCSQSAHFYCVSD